MDIIQNNDSIAIIGVSCRFPGASTPEEFWKILLEGIDVVGEIPASRITIDSIYDEDADVEGKMHQKHGAYLKDIHHFDPLFFNISPKEAMEMHPSQKLMLELAWEAIEGSRVPYTSMRNSRTGVYMGHIWNDFEHFRKERGASINSFSAIGQSANIIASRISYYLGLKGPSFVLDTGCSSSLVALGLAVQGLRNRTMDMCFCGGINHILNPEQYVYLGKFGGLSSKGRCSSFDASADGFVRAEGAGMFLLKRFDDAVRDHDHIHAIIRGCAMNNNGINENLPATSVQGQLDLFRDAYRDANIHPHSIHYVETHGTGTRIGDPNECIALGEFMGKGRLLGSDLHVGSVKTNFGHTEAAAGMAGLLKVVMAMKHRILPKNLHFDNPNPDIHFSDLHLKIQDVTEAWPTLNGETLKCGVSSFGWGGTNVHLVIEEHRPTANVVSRREMRKPLFALPVSARSATVLKKYLELYKEQFKLGKYNAHQLFDICKNASLLRPHFEYRAMLLGENTEELTASLDLLIEKGSSSFEMMKMPIGGKVVFVFPGQGSQWLGMGRQLFASEDSFKTTILQCDMAFQKYTDWSLVRELFAEEQVSQLNKINVIQPAICAIQIALAKLWISWGVIPDAVVGHSMGEVAAAHIAGAISLDDAARIICTRSLLMGSLHEQKGAMAVTELSFEEAKGIAREYADKICVAVHNSPKSTVFAGDHVTIETLMADLEKRQLFCRRVKVDVASHSPQMDVIVEDLRNALLPVRPTTGNIPFFSTVRAQQMDGISLNANYWVENLRCPVQFASIMQLLVAENFSAFVEVSPHPILTNAMQECVAVYHQDFGIFHSLHREKPETYELYNNLTALYTFGVDFRWEFITGELPANHIQLPAYPFEKSNYELEKQTVKLQTNTAQDHPLLGKMLRIAGLCNTFYWENKLSLRDLPFLTEHKVGGTAVFPASAYLEITYKAASVVFPGKKITIRKVDFLQALSIAELSMVDLQVRLEKFDDEHAMLYLYSNSDGLNFPDAWVTNFTAEISCVASYTKDLPLMPGRDRSKASLANFYNGFPKISVDYGELFQNVYIDEVTADGVKATVHLNCQAAKLGRKYLLNPVFLDNIIQPLFAFHFVHDINDHMHFACVLALQEMEIHGELSSIVDGFVDITNISLKEEKKTRFIDADIHVYSSIDRTCLMSMKGVRIQLVDLEIPFNLQKGKEDNKNWVSRLTMIVDENEKLDTIQFAVIQKVAKLIKSSEDTIHPSTTFKSLGIDSIMAVQLRNILEKEFGVKFPVAQLWKHPTFKAFSGYLNELLEVSRQSSTTKDSFSDAQELVVLSSHPDASQRLICFHDAGGDISLFDEWDKLLGMDTEVVCIQMPGRGNRIQETPYRNVADFINAYLPLIHTAVAGKPFIFFGHSMGGLLAFEAARQLQLRYGLNPKTLIVSGTPCLKGYVNHFVNRLFDSPLTDEKIISLLPSSQNIDLQNEYHRSLIQTMKADFELIHDYQYQDGEKLNSAIIVITASQDDRVSEIDILPWKNETIGDFQMVYHSGDHNFVYRDKQFITGIIRQSLGVALGVQHNIL